MPMIWMGPPNGTEEVITVQEAAQLRGVHEQTVYNWIRNGKVEIRRSRPNSRIFLTTESVKAVPTNAKWS